MARMSFKEWVKDQIEKAFSNQFWTRFDEMLDDIEEQGYCVEYATEEYIEVSLDDYDQHYLLYLGQAGRTMWITKVIEA